MHEITYCCLHFALKFSDLGLEVGKTRSVTNFCVNGFFLVWILNLGKMVEVLNVFEKLFESIHENLYF